jgi:hypothetical protein
VNGLGILGREVARFGELGWAADWLDRVKDLSTERPDLTLRGVVADWSQRLKIGFLWLGTRIARFSPGPL